MRAPFLLPTGFFNFTDHWPLFSRHTLLPPSFGFVHDPPAQAPMIQALTPNGFALIPVGLRWAPF